MPPCPPTFVYPEGIYNSCGSPSRKISNPKYDRLEKKAFQAYSIHAFPIGVHTPSGKSGSSSQKVPTPFGSGRVFSAPTDTPSGKASRTRPHPTSREFDEPPSPTPTPKRIKMSLADKAEAMLCPGMPNPRIRSIPASTAAEEVFKPKNLFNREPELSTLARPSTPPPRVPIRVSKTAAISKPSIMNKENHCRPGTPDGRRFVNRNDLTSSPSTKKAYPTGLGLGRPSHPVGSRPGMR